MKKMATQKTPPWYLSTQFTVHLQANKLAKKEWHIRI